MNEELSQFDADLKELFIDSKVEEMNELLNVQPDVTVKELSNYNWSIIKKYYDLENFELLFRHFVFVAYSCFIVEYAHQRKLIGDDIFEIMLSIYNDIYELKRQQK